MDFESLKNQVSNLTLYDLKAGVRKVQNAVMNLTEMESMVREATNADPWGAPSSLMSQIAQGTHNYQQLNEIMPMIYKRFTDKTAEEWRQIYKALQLLEFLVKNGSERVVDDARSHLSLIRMLRQFHFIDQNGKDQGINVRNRSQELAKLLGDVDAIRSERKKARSNKNKYGGVEGGAGLGSGGFSSGGGNRYGGFGSETGGYGGGGYGGEVYGDGGGFGGEDPDLRFQSTQRRGDDFEEYDAGADEDDHHTPPPKMTSPTVTTETKFKRQSQQAAPKKKEPVQDLFEFGDEPAASSKPTLASSPAATSNAMDSFGGDDDFDDFQSATSPAATQMNTSPLAALSPPPMTSTTTSATRFAAPQPVAPAQMAPLSAMLSSPSPAPSASSMSTQPSTMISPTTSQNKPLQPAAPAGGFKPSGPNYFTSVRADINASSGQSSAFSSQRAQTSTPTFGSNYSSSTSMATLGKPTAKPTAPTPGGSDAFGSLWNTASAKAGVQQKATPATKGMGMAAMQKEKSSAGIWGAAATTGVTSPIPRTGAQNPPLSAQSQNSKPAQPLGNGLDDLLG